MNISKTLLAFLLAAFVLAGCFALPAFADEVSDAKAALHQAETRMEQITADYAALQKDVDDLQVQIDDATEGVMAAQDEVQQGRAKLGEMCAYDYKTGGISVLTVLLGSESLKDLVSNLHYMDAMQQAKAEEIKAQEKREQKFSDALADMNQKKDAQMKKLKEAKAKSVEAEQVVANAQASLSKAEADAAAAAEAARLAELEKQAQEMAKAQEAMNESAGNADVPEEKPAETAKPADEQEVEQPAEPSKPKDDDADEAEKPSSDKDEDSKEPSAGSDNASEGSGSGSANGSDGESAKPENPKPEQDAGWKSGVASAYGSKTDGTLGGYTATGAKVTNSSMGVAIPMSWPNYRSYLGRTVEISYGGMTVFATVNDCGGMGGGSRSLDLQPGVWRALGASSCYDWGLRTVSYRFL